MMGIRLRSAAVAAAMLTGLTLTAPGAALAELPGESGAPRMTLAYEDVPMPPGVQVINTELEGPVFADAEGRTLYIWPLKILRNGYSGDPEGEIACYDVVLERTAGLMSPYPAGQILPELETRPSCTDLWRPLLADEAAEPIGDWTILEGTDGRRQWAYDGQAVYTSPQDRQPGDTYGGTHLRAGGTDDPAVREPVGPPPPLPPGFKVEYSHVGIRLVTDEDRSIYAYDKDRPEAVACIGECADTWRPLLAPQLAQSEGEWTVIERAPGVRQWAFRGKPLYVYELDETTDDLGGSDVPGWSNVYAQLTPPFPPEFKPQDTIGGTLLADSRGLPIYYYNCSDDSQDQLSCETPEDTQVYRLAMCGGGDWEKCLVNWPYVIAAENAESPSRLWSILEIDPRTGRRAEAGDPEALRVWAYRDRPVYTYGLDKKPGDVHGDGTGEARGLRNGLKAIWLRPRLR